MKILSISGVDPSKREEDPLIELWKDKSDISSDTAPGLDNKNPNDFSPIKQIKEPESPDLNFIDLDSPEDNKTELTPLVGADSKQDPGDNDDKSKERTSTSRGDHYQSVKDKEGSVSLVPSTSFDNSITVVKHLKDSEVSKKTLHGNLYIASLLDCNCKES